MNSEKQLVKVTHVINPGRFYMFDMTSRNVIDKLREMELKFQAYCASKESLKNSPPSSGDFVFYFAPLSKKWIRCVVDQIGAKIGEEYAEAGEVIVLWALDYGLPATTCELDKLVAMPAEYCSLTGPIFSGSLEVLPSQNKLNRTTNKVELVWHDLWSRESVKYFLKLLRDSSAVYFQQSTNFSDNDIKFGELWLENSAGKMTQMSEELMRKKLAVSVKVTRFQFYYNRTLTSIIDRWVNNERKNPLLLTPDSVLVAEVASTGNDEQKSNHRLLQRLSDYQTQDVCQKNLKSSIKKVTDWKKKNQGFQPDLVADNLIDSPIEEVEKSQALKSLNLSGRSKSDESEASGRPKPIVQQFREVPYEVADESQSSFVRNGSLFTRSGRLILIPSGATNSRNSTGNRDNLDEFERLNLFKKESSSTSDEEIVVGSAPNSNSKQSPLLIAEQEDLKLENENRAREIEETKKIEMQRSISVFKSKPCNNMIKKVKNEEQNKVDEDWMSLDVGSKYSVFVCSFGSCNSFFIQVVDDADNWDDLMDMLREVKILEPMNELKVGKICLVLVNGVLNRAKIIRHSETSVTCFCVDSAELIFYNNECEEIYEIPKEILDFMPFQVVNCRLAGIKAPSDFAWTSIIYSKFVKSILSPEIRVLKKLDSNPDMIPWGLEKVNSYEVNLFEKETNGENNSINNVLVEKQLADRID